MGGSQPWGEWGEEDPMESERRLGCRAWGWGRGWGDKTGEVGGDLLSGLGVQSKGLVFYPRCSGGSTERFEEGR